jgi:hypothetical protein
MNLILKERLANCTPEERALYNQASARLGTYTTTISALTLKLALFFAAVHILTQEILREANTTKAEKFKKLKALYLAMLVKLDEMEQEKALKKALEELERFDAEGEEYVSGKSNKPPTLTPTPQPIPITQIYFEFELAKGVKPTQLRKFFDTLLVDFQLAAAEVQLAMQGNRLKISPPTGITHTVDQQAKIALILNELFAKGYITGSAQQPDYQAASTLSMGAGYTPFPRVSPSAPPMPPLPGTQKRKKTKEEEQQENTQKNPFSPKFPGTSAKS